MIFVCPYCGEFSKAGDNEPVKDGSVIPCSECGKPTVFDVQTQEGRAAQWRQADAPFFSEQRRMDRQGEGR